jgi:hypothetical protein
MSQENVSLAIPPCKKEKKQGTTKAPVLIFHISLD